MPIPGITNQNPYGILMPDSAVKAYGNPQNSPVQNASPVSQVEGIQTEATKAGDRKTSKLEKQAECQTCKNRKYVDGSNEGNVSFKTPGHIDPNASAGVVRSHENEHVANAVKKGNEPGNELVSAKVSLKMAICPECGKAYVAGGTTRTQIRYGNTDFDKNKKAMDQNALLGANVDMKA